MYIHQTDSIVTWNFNSFSLTLVFARIHEPNESDKVGTHSQAET